ncbi:MAG TPA: PA2169 family four-helix-bundle protein, partial [Burkholderiaceae bacterium]|nr:PA2169 family four-helix-bundle protein [Burkholderiaceae bacterium]
ENGFRSCADQVEDAHLREVFRRGAERCEQAADELEALVRARGETPQHGGTVSGALHRGWLNLRTALGSNDNHAVLEECERGEDYAVDQYREALEQPLPPDVRAVVERQYRGAIANHDQVRALRDRYPHAG